MKKRWAFVVAGLLAVGLAATVVVSLAQQRTDGPTSAAESPTAATSPDPAAPEESRPPSETDREEFADMEVGVVWQAGHENGDLSEWSGVTTSDTADADVVSAPVHVGDGALALTVYHADGSSSPGVRMRVEETAISPPDDEATDNLPDDAYYSAWYYFPQKLEPHSNVMQWKQAAKDAADHQTRKLLYFIRADWDAATESFQFHLRGKAGEDRKMLDETYSVATSPLRVPTEEWVHLECRYQWAPSGRITCWQDGDQIWDVRGIVTEYDYDYLSLPRQWTINNYASDTRPRTHTIYVDNATISLHRRGP